MPYQPCRWRSHIARKKVEGAYSSAQLYSLKEDYVIVISDFKMKLLNMYFRESTQMFYGKRGTVYLRMRVLSNVNHKEETVDVDVFLLLSNGTTQDTEMVLAGKAFIYDKILPEILP